MIMARSISDQSRSLAILTGYRQILLGWCIRLSWNGQAIQPPSRRYRVMHFTPRLLPLLPRVRISGLPHQVQRLGPSLTHLAYGCLCSRARFSQGNAPSPCSMVIQKSR